MNFLFLQNEAAVSSSSDDLAGDPVQAAAKLQKFWKESDMLVSLAPEKSKLRDIAKFNVIVKEDCLPQKPLHLLEQDKKVCEVLRCGKRIHTQDKYLCYPQVFKSCLCIIAKVFPALVIPNDYLLVCLSFFICGSVFAPIFSNLL